MKWYWWVLIGVGVVAIGYLKMVVWNKMLAKKQEAQKRKDEEE